MSSMPLPPLAAQPSPLETYKTILGIKSLQQQQQLQSQQIQQNQMQMGATQALNKSYQDAVKPDENGVPQIDTEAITKSLSTAGYGAQIPKVLESINAFNKSRLEIQTSQADLQSKRNDLVANAAASIKAANYDPALAHTLLDTLPQSPQLNVFRSKIDNPVALKQMVDQAVAGNPKQQAATTAAQTAQARSLSSETQAKELTAKLPGGPLNPVTQAVEEAKEKAPIELQNAVARETDPTVIAAHAQQAAQTAIAVEKAHQAMYPAALAGVQPNLIAPATADATKADQLYTSAKQAGNEVHSMVQLAKSGNKVAYAYSPVTGVLQINVAGQIKRMNMPEIESYGGAGSAADRIKGWFGKQASGASIPENILNDMDSVSQMVTKGASDKYQQDINAINSRYGAKFQPMGGAAQGGGPPASQAAPLTVNAGGKTYTFKDQKSLNAFKKEAGLP